MVTCIVAIRMAIYNFPFNGKINLYHMFIDLQIEGKVMRDNVTYCNFMIYSMVKNWQICIDVFHRPVVYKTKSIPFRIRKFWVLILKISIKVTTVECKNDNAQNDCRTQKKQSWQISIGREL